MFAPLAFGWLVLGFLQQGKELRMSNEELQNSVNALKLQADELRNSVEQQKIMSGVAKSQYEEIIAQRKDQSKSQDEVTFFKMLETFNQAVINMDRASGGKIITGKDVISLFNSRLERGIKIESRSNLITFDIIIHQYEKFYGLYQNDFSHYFRLMYNTIKFIDNSKIDNKKIYSNIFRANMSDDEVTILLINGLSEKGRSRFKPLIEKYSLLKHYRQDFVNIDLLVAAYAPTAFAGTR